MLSARKTKTLSVHFDEYIMPGITDLPQHVQETIFDYLSDQTLQSLSLTARPWSHVYKQRSCRVLEIDLTLDTARGKSTLLQTWERLNLLQYVRRIAINDSGERSKEGQKFLHDLSDHWLPELSGLECVSWDLSGKPVVENATQLTSLPAGVLLDLTCEGNTPKQTVADILGAVQGYDALRKLVVAFDQADEASLSQILKATLLSCKNLTALEINVTNDREEVSPAASYGDEAASSLSWTADKAAQMPALRHLDLHCPSLTAEIFEIWARHGNWRSLQTLTAHHGWFLEHLSGRLPALRRVSVSTVEFLPEFLAAQPQIQSLVITDLQTSVKPTDVADALRDILELPVASNLKELELRTAQAEDVLDQATVDVGAIAKACHKLTDLTVAVTSQQYRNAVGYFCWMDACIESVVEMSSLRRLCIVLPRVIPSGSLSIPPEIVIMTAVVDLWVKLGAHGQKLQELRLIASMDSEKPETERETAVLHFVSPISKALTFVVTPGEKDCDAEQGSYRTSCPELEEAERLILRGDLSRLSQTGEYSIARRTVDDISTYVHRGTIVPKKKPRPMPVWLTPEEEQDRREGPPSQARRAKRALIRSMGEFTGAWRLPMTETSPRTAEERAQSRENGFGGRAGWSKSSLAMRVFYRR